MKSILSLSLAMVFATGPLFAQQKPDSKTETPAIKIPAPKKGASKDGQKSGEDRKQAEASSSSADKALGGTDPGGGAWYRINGQLKTLSEAGAIVERVSHLAEKKYPVPYFITNETKKALEDIFKAVPLGNFKTLSPSRILDARDTFIDQKNINPSDYETIRKAYARVINSYGKTFNEVAFTLAAYSDDSIGKSYILPAFEEKSPNEDLQHFERRRALIVIHEYMMRTKFSNLQGLAKLNAALQLDEAIYQILENGLNAKNEFRLYICLNAFGFVTKGQLNEIRFQQLQTTLGRPILASEILVDTYDKQINPSFMQKFNSYFPNIAQYFEGSQVLVISPYEWSRFVVSNGKWADMTTALAFRRNGIGSHNEFPKSLVESVQANLLSSFESNPGARNDLWKRLDLVCNQFGQDIKKSGVLSDAFIYRDQETGTYFKFDCDKTRDPSTNEVRYSLEKKLPPEDYAIVIFAP